MKECTGRGNAEKFSINCRKLVLCVFYETILFISGKAGSQFDCRPLLGSFCCVCWRKYAEPEKAVFDLIIQGCVIFLGKGYNTAPADAVFRQLHAAVDSIFKRIGKHN